MCTIHTGNAQISYKAVRDAMDWKSFTMSLTSTDELKAVSTAVNQGIDSHLEACFCPERGDQYEGGTRMVGSEVLCRTMECRISPESMPVLLRRLFELDADDDLVDTAYSLASDILTVLGFDEYGERIGREALGLE